MLPLNDCHCHLKFGVRHCKREKIDQYPTSGYQHDYTDNIMQLSVWMLHHRQHSENITAFTGQTPIPYQSMARKYAV